MKPKKQLNQQKNKMHYSIQFFKLCTVALLVFFTACKKDETDTETINDEDRLTSKEYSSAETAFTAVWNMTLEAAQNEPSLNGFVYLFVAVVFDTTTPTC